MSFTEFELKYIDTIFGRLCKRKSSTHPGNQGRTVYAVEDHDVVLYEERPIRTNPREWTSSGIAKFTYNRKHNVWMLYWMGQDLKWYPYGPLPESLRIDRLVVEVDKDPDGAFFNKLWNYQENGQLEIPQSDTVPPTQR